MMHGNGQRSVTVDRLKLIEQLKANLVTHVADYKEALTGYRIKLYSDLRETLHEVEMASDTTVLKIKAVQFNQPRSYEKEYTDAITMLEWQVGETVELDQSAFKQFVQNEWSWSGGFEVMNTTYKAFAASAMR